MVLFSVWLRLKFLDITMEKVKEGNERKRVNVKDKLIGLLSHRGKINQDNNLKHFTNTSKGKGNNLRKTGS